MNDPRELPVSYGPPQLFGSRIKETIDSLDPEMAHFANSVGAAMKKRGNVDFVMKGAFMGQTPAELAEFADAENAQQEALQMAKESMKMSGQKFEELYGQLDGEVQNRTALPEPEKAQGVSPWQAAYTLLGISAAPQNAFEIGAQPFLANDRLAKEQDQRNLIQYEQDERARKERIGLIETRMGVEESRRREAASDVDRISAELRRLSEVRYREGKQAEGKMLELRAQAYSAKDLGELRGIADFMDGLIRQNPNLAHHALRSDELLGLRGEIEKKAQLEIDAEKDKGTGQVVDDFRAWVSSNFPQNSRIGPKELAKINAERDRIASVTGVHPSRFPQYTERESLQDDRFEYQRERDKIADDKWRATMAAEGKITLGPDGSYTPNLNYKDKNEKGKAFDSAQKKVDTAKQNVAKLLAIPGKKIGDPKHLDAVLDAVTDEWMAVRTKRMLSTGVDELTSVEDYMAQAYPDLHEQIALMEQGMKVASEYGNFFGGGTTPYEPKLKGPINNRPSKPAAPTPKKQPGGGTPSGWTLRKKGG